MRQCRALDTRECLWKATGHARVRWNDLSYPNRTGNWRPRVPSRQRNANRGTVRWGQALTALTVSTWIPSVGRFSLSFFFKRAAEKGRLCLFLCVDVLQTSLSRIVSIWLSRFFVDAVGAAQRAAHDRAGRGRTEIGSERRLGLERTRGRAQIGRGDARNYSAIYFIFHFSFMIRVFPFFLKGDCV